MKLPTIAVAITICSTIHAFQPSFTSPTSTQWHTIQIQNIRRRHSEIPHSSTFSSPIVPSTRTTLRSSNLPELGDASRFRSNNHINSDNDNSNAKPPLPLNPKGVIFDMDGTLIQHVIDFPSMRRRIYQVADDDPIGKNLEKTCVLELAAQLSPEGRRKADEIFREIEERALRDMELKEGAVELMRFLGERGLRRGVLTRNMERNVFHMKKMYHAELTKWQPTQENMEDETNVSFDEESIFHAIVARNTKSNPEDEEPIKSKPHPDGILHICSLWGCHPSEVIMVGDSANDDMTAANRAGCGGAVLLTQPGGTRLDTDSGYAVGHSEEEIRERTPSLIVESLLELRDCLKAVMEEEERKKENGSSVGLAEAKKDGMVYNFENSDYSVVIPGISVKNV